MQLMRYATLKSFISKHAVSAADDEALSDAIAWADSASIKKQQQEEHDVDL